MRRAISVMAAGAAVLTLGAATASADVVSKRVIRCDADMTWQLTGSGGSTVAQVTFATAPTGCHGFHVGVQDDLDPFLIPEDSDSAQTQTYRLFGVSSEGTDYTFAGTLTQEGGPATGPVVIAAGLLNGQLTAVWPDGSVGTVVHTGTGTCGSRCYETHAVWVSAGS